MAAYASLLSLNVTIKRVHNPIRPIKRQIKYLTETTTFFLGFLERNSKKNSSKEIQDVESKITFLCNKTEDLFETIEIAQIHKQTYSSYENPHEITIAQLIAQAEDPDWCRDDNPSCEEMSTILFEYLREVTEEFDNIKEKAKQLDTGIDLSKDISPVGSFTASAQHNNNNNTMIGFEEHLEVFKKKMVSTEFKLLILPVTGMGGIGKTTLARNVFDDQLIKEHFKIRLWIPISQSYKLEYIFQNLLSQLDHAGTEHGESELGLKLYQSLIGWRYIVVLDDVWSGEVWEKIKAYFPEDNNGSRVIITTRELKVASYTGSSGQLYELEPLDEKTSWELLKQKVFPNKNCPSVLEDIGRKIVISCKGLPLALVVIGGQLAKSKSTRESWQFVADDVNSVLNSEGDDDCMNILSLSYDNLPIHLKPCFLFMGVFPEDNEVRVSKLVKLWVAEGLVKSIEGKCFEDTALMYLTDLVERNLIMVGKRGSRGNIVSCQIHDLLRDVCLRESYRQGFLCSKRSYGLPCTIVPELQKNIVRARGDGSILYPSRSFTTSRDDDKLYSHEYEITANDFNNMLFVVRYRILIFTTSFSHSNLLESLNSSQARPLWQNIQTLIIRETFINELFLLPPLIWAMTQLRHLEIEQLVLPYPPKSANEKGRYVLENLQTLLDAHNLQFSEELILRIPNVKKLKILYTEEPPESVEDLSNYYCLDGLDRLLKLESLSYSVSTNIHERMRHVSFPSFLKKLTMDGCRIPWDNMTMLGSLFHLEVLRLRNHAFCGAEWTPIDGEFGNLKSLHLQTICLQQWEVEESHFPSLESLILCDVWGMEDIPRSFGDVETLKLVSLEFCSTSLVDSAETLEQDQKEEGNDQLQVKVRRTNNARDRVWKLEKHLECFRNKTSENVSRDLACQIEALLAEADGAIKVMVTHKRETNINLLCILEEIKDLHCRLQAIYPHDGAISQDRNYAHAGSAESNEPSTVKQEQVVGFEDEAKKLIGCLKEHSCLLHSIIGESGAGKTTLAKMIYHDPEVQREFPTRIWCPTAYTARQIYLSILSDFTEVRDQMIHKTVKELARTVAAYLRTEKFLIVLNAKLDSNELYYLCQHLPRTGKVLIMDRDTTLERSSHEEGVHIIRRLTEDESWLLLQLEVFGKPESPRELEYYGKLIVDCCDGLPLAIVVIAGILANKFHSTKDLSATITQWKNVAENTSKIQRRSIESIIALSYDDMTFYHLRACFLYLGMFPEDYEISAWKLTRMWITEGFIQRTDDLNLEEVADKYLVQLIDRNLIRVDKRRRDGKVKTCRLCTEIRFFCLIEALHEQEIFFDYVDGFEGILQSSCRIFFPDNSLRRIEIKIRCPLVRTFLITSSEEMNPATEFTALKLLRVLDVKPFKFTKFPSEMFKLIHLSYIAISLNSEILPAEFSEFWNIQTLIVHTFHRTLEVKTNIWKMKQLRHFKTNASASLPKAEHNSIGGVNMQTLAAVSPQTCTGDEFSSTASNLKKLAIRGKLVMLFDLNGSVDFLAKLEKLEELKLANDVFPRLPHEDKLHGLPQPCQFPPKLRCLTLTATFLDWTCMSVLGLLENLKVLKLKDEAFTGNTWETTGRGFHKLETLYISRTDLVFWMASKEQFPSLSSLELRNCEELIQIPIELADIPSFHMLRLYGTSSAVAAAKEIHSIKDGQYSNGSVFKLSISRQVCSRSLIDLNTVDDLGLDEEEENESFSDEEDEYDEEENESFSDKEEEHETSGEEEEYDEEENESLSDEEEEDETSDEEEEYVSCSDCEEGKEEEEFSDE